ncbi:adenosine kinase [Sphingomonas panacisoli]|uniref:Adenosine kinase n=1 Tax=Sphingomonas panacisoli TaxID=1813879 RepID=A0A5B8LFT4_9SPHN|nr:adenosine kinase [Sphingomonas panacisoli]QDZ06625.1 adenosine kinase [Sphingomonas panacisoli]
MSNPTYDVVAIGNAIVDILSQATDEFIVAEGMTKGGMQLIFDPAAADDLYSRMGPGREVSGGSAANTIAGLAALGHATGFIGQVADDQLGKVFAHDVQALGVHFETAAATGGDPTGRCLVLITPDGQRTMNTFLGAAQFLPEAAVDQATIEAGAILYLEGYLWNADQSRGAMKRAIAMARDAGRKVALTLSDVFVVEGHRAEFFELIDAGQIDILFANDNEVRSMMQDEDIKAAVEGLSARVPLLVCTHGAAGAEAHKDGEHARISAEPVDDVVDTTGAGDLFAAGFLAGQAQGRNLETSLRMGAICAAECISHIGPRPVADIKKLVADKLG